MRLIYNSDAKRLQKDFDDKTPITVAEMFRSERTGSVPLELFLVDNDGGYATPGTSDYEVVIGRQAQELTTGKLKLTFTGTTEEIDLSKPKLATRIEAALNAVSEINSAGGVDVIELNNGRAYQITFRSNGSRAAITAGVSDSMQPASALVSEVTAGTGSSREIQLLTLEEASLAEVGTSAWSANSNPALTISTLVEGTANTREVSQLSISGDPAPGSFFVVSNSEPISTEATAAQVKSILNSALSSDIGSVKKTGERIWQITYKTNGDKTALSAGTHNLVKRPSVTGTLSLNTTALAYAANSDGSDLSIGFTLRKSNEVVLSEKINLSEPFAEVLGSSAMLNNDSIGALFSISSNDVGKGKAIALSGGLTYDGTTLNAPLSNYLPLAGGTMTGAAIFNDNVKAIFGTSSDGLEIYHDENNSVIKDSGTGVLNIQGSTQVNIGGVNGQNGIQYLESGAVKLRHANVTKFNTDSTGCTISGKLIVNGDMDVSGTTTTFNSTVVTVDDPVFTVGGDTAPGSDDNKDRGIEFRYYSGSAKVGFFGYDDSEDAFTFLTDATNNSEVFDGTLGNLKTKDITLSGGTLQLDSAYAIQWGNGNNRIFGSSGNNYIRFDTNGAEAARFDSSGQFIVKDHIRLDDTYKIQWGGTNSRIDGSHADNFLRFFTNNTEAARFDSDGHLLLNSTSSTGDVFQSTATDGIFAARLIGSQNSGQSNGLRIRAGFTSSDHAMLVENWSGTDLLKIKGDGSAYFNSQTTNTVATFESTDTGAGILLADDTGTSKLETSGAELRVSCDDNDAVNNSVIKFRLDGATKATLDSTGLGIGCTPSAKLDVQLEAGAWNVGSSFTNKAVRISGGSGGLGLAYDDTTGATIAAIHHGNSWKKLNFGAVEYHYDINGSEVMRLNSTGLGIGTTPHTNQQLHIASSGSGLEFSTSQHTNESRMLSFDRVAGAYRPFRLQSSETKFEISGTEAARFDSSGCLGINQPSPSSTYKLDVGGSVRLATAAPSLVFRETDSSNQEFSLFGLGGDFYIRDITNSSYPFKVQSGAGNDTLVIDSNSRVGIGGTPVEKLTIEDGHIRMSDGYKIDWGGTNVRIDGSNADGYFRAFIGSSEAMRLNSTGLGIGVTPSAFLHVSKDNDNSGNQFCVADTEGTTAAVRTYTHGGDAQGLILNHYYALAGSGNEYMRYADIVSNVGNGAGTAMRFITKNAANTYSTTIIDNEGRLGIGVTPSEQLTNYSASGNVTTLTQVGGSGNADLQLKNNSGDRTIRATADKLWFIDNTDTRTDMVIDGSGNVGIGTTSPSCLLDIYNASGWGELHLDGSSGGELKLQKAGTTHLDLYASDSGSTGSVIKAQSNLLISSNNTTDANRSIYLNSSGNVGIGTTSPLNTFQISEYSGANGTQSISGTASIFANSGDDVLYLGLKNGSYQNRGYSFQTVQNGVNADFVIKEHGLTGERIRLASSGNVGISTTVPSHLLSLGTSDNATGKKLSMFLGNTGTYSAIGAQRGETNLFCSSEIRFINEDNSSGTGAISLATGTNSLTEKMRIASDGNVGIGTTAPLNTFQISEYSGSNGTQSISGTASIFANSGDDVLYLGLKNGSYQNRGYSFQTIQNGVNADFVIKEHGLTGERIRLASSGNVGIGTDSPSAKLEIAGNTDEDSNFLIIRDKDPSSGSARPSVRFAKEDGTILGQLLALDGANQRLQFSGNNTEDNHLTVYNNGNIGISVTAPSAKLEISDSASANIRLSTTDTDIAESQELGALEYYQADNSGTVGAGVKASMRAIADNATAAQTALTFGTSDSSNNDKLRLKISGDGDITQNYINYTDGSNYEALKISAESDHIKFNTSSIGSFASNNRSIKFHVGDDKMLTIDSNGIWSEGNVYVNSTGSVRNASDHLNLSTSSQTNNDIIFKPNNTEAVRIFASTLRIHSAEDKAWTVGDKIASLEFFSADQSGSGPNSVRSEINLVTENTFGSAHSLSFATRADVSGSPTEKAKITSSGDMELVTDDKGLILSSANGTRYRITCANDGTVTSTAV